MYQMKARCSMLHKLMPEARDKTISDTAKSAVREIVKYDLFGYQAFEATNTQKKGSL